MYFLDYKKHQAATLRPSLLWEYDLTHFDWEAMRKVVVQRVVELGRRDDFYAMLNLYGVEKVRETIKTLPLTDKKNIAFVCREFEIDNAELQCYTEKPFRMQLGSF